MSQNIVKLQFNAAQPSLQDRLAHAWTVFWAMQKAAATRRQLATLDDRSLSDIGISRAQAQFEAEAPIWDYHR